MHSCEIRCAIVFMCAGYEVTAQVPGDAELIRFGLTLIGPGQAGPRNVEPVRATASGLARP